MLVNVFNEQITKSTEMEIIFTELLLSERMK